MTRVSFKQPHPLAQVFVSVLYIKTRKKIPCLFFFYLITCITLAVKPSGNTDLLKMNISDLDTSIQTSIEVSTVSQLLLASLPLTIVTQYKCGRPEQLEKTHNCGKSIPGSCQDCIVSLVGIKTKATTTKQKFLTLLKWTLHGNVLECFPQRLEYSALPQVATLWQSDVTGTNTKHLEVGVFGKFFFFFYNLVVFAFQIFIYFLCRRITGHL